MPVAQYAMNENIIILGGYGNTGLKVANLLLRYTNVSITLAARNMDRLKTVVNQLNQQYSTNRVSSVYADASDEESLLLAFKRMDMVVVASGTAEYAEIVASTALKSGIDYLDVQFSLKKVKVLKSMEGKIERSGRCFITDGGFHPGLPAALVRYGAQYFDQLEIAIVGSFIQQDWGSLNISLSTAIEFVRELVDFQSMFYRDGQWRKASMVSTKDFIEMEFMAPFGKQLCAPMFFEEMREIPAVYPSLTHTGFYIAGFHKFVDMVVMPFILLMVKLFPNSMQKPMAKIMFWSLKTFSKPPYATIMKLEATGEKEGQPKKLEVQLYHEDGYWFTAIPVVACLLQYLEGVIRKPGLWTMGNLVEPHRLMKDMERMGIEVSEKIIME